MSKQVSARCGSCRHKLRIPAKYAGRKVSCPSCYAKFLVPTEAVVLAALPERYVCEPVEPPAGDTQIRHPVDPVTPGTKSRFKDTLIVGNIEEDSGPPLPDQELDELLDLPDVRYADGTSSGPGYSVVGGNRLVIEDPDRPYFVELATMVAGLEGTEQKPITVDISPLDHIDMRVMARIVYAIAFAHVCGKPARLRASGAQQPFLQEMILDGVLGLSS